MGLSLNLDTNNSGYLGAGVGVGVGDGLGVFVGWGAGFGGFDWLADTAFGATTPMPSMAAAVRASRILRTIKLPRLIWM
jgi:hypothetical protein